MEIYKNSYLKYIFFFENFLRKKEEASPVKDVKEVFFKKRSCCYILLERNGEREERGESEKRRN